MYIEEAQYVIGERGGTLTVRIRRRGFLWDATDVTVGKAKMVAHYIIIDITRIVFIMIRTPGTRYEEMPDGIPRGSEDGFYRTL